MKKIQDAFEAFEGLKIMVVGDVMIDSYILGSVSRISPEAPVPIINLNKQEDRLGGAANVALNLVALGVQTEIVSVIGKDIASELMKDLLKESNIAAHGLVESTDRKTTIKTRVIGNQQHLLRVDNEQTNEITPQEELALIAQVEKGIANGVQAIILEDYNKGVLTEKVIESIVYLANKNNVITTVDPKKDHFFTYRNVTLFKPNLKELREGLNVSIDMQNIRTLENAIQELESRLHNKISFVTLSEHGVFVKEGGQSSHLKAHKRDIADVSGAGDTVIGVATACLAAGLNPVEMAQIANLAGGIVCEHSGVVAIDKQILLQEVARVYDGH
ncbi:MAG: bifunctional ADP-heptose synthase [Crocinitomicaceae bacterium]|jgi:rfaE bifunctional protein kinase chain/domain|nr:bifunctional ADP-heptose synthase [Crocinitomicaceae bacterium]